MLPNFTFGNPNLCTYCGDDAQSIDHVIAVAYQKSQNRFNTDKLKYGPITYCCSSCNSFLGSSFFDSFELRCRYVSGKLNERAFAVLWTEAEIKKLDYSLADYIQREKNKRLWYRFRSDWFQSREFLLNLEELKWQPILDKTSPKYNEQLFNYFQTTLSFLNLLYKSY